MADRSIVIRLRAEVGAYKQSLAEAAKATREVGEQATRSARANREAWNTAGTALTAYGVGVTALGGALLKTGVAYNQLRQQSTAALTTLLGSGKAAADQMDRLDAFARTSPFARQTFITAQQQLLGFGMAADKVLPTLDAIQNAVAAFGGSNQQIEEVAFVLAQISAAGKITAQDLMQLGQRGIDAATLIGSQMGMTGAQIRESITAGTLGAEQALDALTAGMAQRFDGAADNVKNTFAGAMDRVKAAWRDLGSELATPLVNPEGGGLLVDLANNAADAARAFEDLPGPVKNGAAAFIAASGAASLAGGAFLLLLPRVVETRKAFKTLSTDMPRTSGALREVGKAASYAGALMSAFYVAAAIDNNKDPVAGLERTKRAVLDLANGTGELEAVFSRSARTFSGPLEITAEINGLADAFAALQVGGFDKLTSWVPGATREWDLAAESFQAFDAALTAMVQEGHLDEAAAAASYFGDEARKAGLASSEAANLLPGYQDALIGVENAGGSASSAVDAYTRAAAGAAAASKEEAEAIRSAVEAMREKRNAALSAINAEIGYRAAIDGAREALAENGRTLDLNTEAGRDNMSALTNLAASWNQLSDRQKNATGAAREARRQFVELATEMGMGEEKAQRLARRLLEIKPRRVRVDVETAAAEASISRVRDALSALRGSMSSLGSINPLAHMSVPRMNPVRDRAEGGYISGPGGPTDDLIPARLSNGEYVIRAAAVAHYGVGTFDALNEKRFASGGSVGKIDRAARQSFDLRGGMSMREVGREFAELRRALGRNTDALAAAQKHSQQLARAWNRLDKQVQRRTERLADFRADRDSLRSAAAASFNNDPFGNGVAGLRLQLEADRNDARAMRAALAGTQGLGKGLLEALAASGDLATAQELAGMSRAEVRQLSRLYNQRGNAQTALGNYAGREVYGDAIKRQAATLNRLDGTMKKLERRLNSWERAAERMPNATAREIRRAVNRQALPAGKRNG